jgi:hypothetical protein
VISANLLLALSSDAPGGKQRKAQVRIACRLEPDLLLEMAGEKIEAQDQLLWNSARERLEQVSRLSYGKVTLDESRFWAGPSKAGALLLMKAALAKGPSVYDPDGHLEALTVRLALLCRVLPELVPSFADGAEPFLGEVLGGGQLQASRLTEHALLVACESRASLEQLAEARLDQEMTVRPADPDAPHRVRHPLLLRADVGRIQQGRASRRGDRPTLIDEGG